MCHLTPTWKGLEHSSHLINKDNIEILNFWPLLNMNTQNCEEYIVYPGNILCLDEFMSL